MTINELNKLAALVKQERHALLAILEGSPLPNDLVAYADAGLLRRILQNLIARRRVERAWISRS